MNAALRLYPYIAIAAAAFTLAASVWARRRRRTPEQRERERRFRISEIGRITDGTVIDLQMTSGGNPDLELAASNAIRRWEFTPTLLNCIAIEVPMQITVSFKPAQ